MIISILCGGSGTRLWPLSRAFMPKQFVKLIGNDSLFKISLKRNVSLLDSNSYLQVITNEKQYFLAVDEAKSENIQISSFILESIPRNTAAALTISALLIAKTNPDEVILVLPSDHLIQDEMAYKQSVQKAQSLAAQGHIVLFGIKPDSAHTGYGYIQVDSKDSSKVIAFHEKPDKQKAKEYIQNGGYYWNSGMFCYQAKILLDEIKKYELEIYQSCVDVVESISSGGEFIRLDRKLSEKIPEKSIDYAVMEKTKKLRLVEATFKWNDVGSFDSLDNELQKDCNNNTSKNDLECVDSKNNLILSDKTVATIGLNDFVVVDTYDALLIAKKGQTQEVKKIVESLNKKGSELALVHNQVFRPWGSYTVLQESKGYKLKSIIVKPKQRLSLQKHYHRNEHWIVVSGSAIVQVGDKEIFLRPNESTYIPMGEIHRLTNPGNIDLIMIEVQVGEYLGEDDIVRLQDDYNR